MCEDSEYKHYKPVLKGRGAIDNPSGRYEALTTAVDSDAMDAIYDPEEEEQKLQRCTQVFYDKSRTIVATNDSPDIGMEATVNPYRGCEHGCIYCFARPGHEYFGLSVGIDFETKIFAKPEAAKLLEQKLSSPSWKPEVVTMSGVTDCYQPIEKKLKITRGCMEVLRDFRNPVAIITKNYLVTRDIDIFREMAKYNCIVVNMSVTTLDNQLARTMEPRASQPLQRLRAIEALSKAGVPVRVMIGPVLPGLTEHEIPAILKETAAAGALGANYTMLRLPYGVKDIFQTWVHEHYPDKAKKILNRIKEVRGGRLNDPRFGSRMRGEGFHAEQIAHIFKMSRKRYGLDKGMPTLTTQHFRRDGRNAQINLFDGSV